MGDVLDNALEHLSLLKLADELGAALLLLGLEKSLVGDYHVAELLIYLDNLAVDVLVDILVVVTDGLDVDLRTGQERLDSEHVHDHAALGAGLDEALDDLVVLVSLVHPVPGLESAGLAVREHELALPVLCGLHIDLDLVADLEVGIVTELGDGDHALALASDVDNDFTLGERGHLSLDYFVLDNLGKSLVVCLLDGLPVLGAVAFAALERVPVEVLGLH